jgi:serine/threonine protein kinase
MATRGGAYRNERGPRGGSAGSRRDSTGSAAAAGVASDATRIADRYRLEDRISESGQSTLWRAFDDALGRPVTLRTFGAGFVRAAEVVAAARAACRVQDGRLARVFDAHVAADGAYIVTEWPDGENLEDLLMMGHLDVTWATRIVAEAASALATAHAAGIAHLRLSPRSVLWSRDVGVKIIGLGIDAALAGAVAADAADVDPAYVGLAGAAAVSATPAASADKALTGTALTASVDTEPRGIPAAASPDAATSVAAALADPASVGIQVKAPADAGRQTVAGAESARAAAALADTRALARVLYAALTGYWPGRRETALPAAPRRDGRPYRPRQVRAGLPARIDDITCRALFAPLPRDPIPVTSPGQLAELLRGALRPESRPAQVAAPPEERFMDGTYGQPPWPRSRHRARTLAAGGVLGALFVIDSALIGVSIMGAVHPTHVAGPVARTQAPPVARSHRAPTRLLIPASAQAFDPYGAGEDENNEVASAAIDGNPGTAWHTFWYTTPRFGNLKPGTGLVVDMGRSVTITNVGVRLGSIPGANVQLRIGDRADSLSDMGIAATANDASGQLSLQSGAAYRGRYVAIWFTKLPPHGDGHFQADIYDVAVHGS